MNQGVREVVLPVPARVREMATVLDDVKALCRSVRDELTVCGFASQFSCSADRGGQTRVHFIIDVGEPDLVEHESLVVSGRLKTLPERHYLALLGDYRMQLMGQLRRRCWLDERACDVVDWIEWRD